MQSTHRRGKPPRTAANQLENPLSSMFCYPLTLPLVMQKGAVACCTCLSKERRTSSLFDEATWKPLLPLNSVGSFPLPLRFSHRLLPHFEELGIDRLFIDAAHKFKIFST
jgi:hypothetical protein